MNGGICMMPYTYNTCMTGIYKSHHSEIFMADIFLDISLYSYTYKNMDKVKYNVMKT